MRIDHHAYQRATRVAGFGLLLQLAIGVLLLLFGNVGHDSAMMMASAYVLPGTLVWLGLIIIFHQHKLERLEALEEDELTSSKAAAGSFFDRAGDETRVAARRLALMHKWLLPILSLVLAITLAGAGWLMWRYMHYGVFPENNPSEFHTANERGWAIAICLAIAAVSFIFSRFVAGMAKQVVWQNLRGGAAYMVGNALVMLAISGGIIFRFFNNDRAIEYVAYAIPIFMVLVAAEITLNLVLNLYRPRIPGEVPRPAFDSKLLSLFATPDSIVRSMNEAVNYQFGFDVTSSWGYQLLLRSVVSLLVLGVLAMVAMSTMVVVEPHQQAVKLRFGKVVDDRVYDSGLLWKWPWPIESAAVYDVTRLRSLNLTPHVIDQQRVPVEQRVYLWDKSDAVGTDGGEMEPFIVGSPVVSRSIGSTRTTGAASTVGDSSASLETEPTEEEQAAEAVSDFYSLIDAEIVLQYRIRQQNQGLIDYLHFAPESKSRRQLLTDRERAIKLIAISEVSRHFTRTSLDEVLAVGRGTLAGMLQQRIQAALDREQSGIEVVAINFPYMKPAAIAAPSFEELNVSTQARLERIAQAKRNAFGVLSAWAGNVSIVDQVLEGIEEYDRLRATLGNEAAETIEQRQRVVDMLLQGNGQAAQEIAVAEKDRWVTLMSHRSQAERVQGQLAAYRASPELYRQLETMKVYRQYLPFIDKYVIAIDTASINIDADLKRISPILEFAGASEEEKRTK